MTNNLLFKGFQVIFENLKYMDVSYSLLVSIIITCIFHTIFNQIFSLENKILDLIKKL